MREGTAEVFEQFFQSRMEMVHTILPGKIEEYYGHDERKAKVSSLVKFFSYKNTKIEIPVMDEVPVIFPSSADFSMLWPLVVGDGCLLLFSEAALGNMLAGDGSEVVDPEDYTRCQLQNCICLPGFWSFSAVPQHSDNDDDFFLLYKGKKITIQKDSDVIKIDSENSSSGSIEFNGNTKKFVTYTELNSALQTFITALGTHTHVCAAPGSPSATPLPLPSLDISASETITIKTGG